MEGAKTPGERGSEDIDVVLHGGRVRFARFLNALAEAGFDVDPVKTLKEASEDGHAAFAVPVEVGGCKASIAVDLILPTLPFEKTILASGRPAPPRVRILKWFATRVAAFRAPHARIRSLHASFKDPDR
jgi:hypothetical protein